MALRRSQLKYFPKLLAGEYYQETSDASDNYNCIAWVAGDTTRRWWPARRYYWPPEAPYEESVEAFVDAFRLQGYEPCGSTELEDQFEKVAIYVGWHGRPTHAAIQKSDGLWSSKLGGWVDIEHMLDGVEGPLYGRVAVVLRRPRGG